MAISGLRALLSQMGILQLQTGQGAEGGKGMKASGMKGQKGAPNSQALGDEGLLLTGLGYAESDVQTNRKNTAERSNLTRFLQKQLRDSPAPRAAVLTEEGVHQRFEEAGPDAPTEAAEGHEANAEQELSPQERRDNARVQGQKESAEQAELRESSETAEAEQQQQQRDDSEEEDKPGAGWVAEEQEEEGEQRKRGLRTPDVLADSMRCHGTLEDGTRCLRKARDGTPYCAVHAASWTFVPPTSGPPSSS